MGFDMSKQHGMGHLRFNVWQNRCQGSYLHQSCCSLSYINRESYSMRAAPLLMQSRHWRFTLIMPGHRLILVEDWKGWEWLNKHWVDVVCTCVHGKHVAWPTSHALRQWCSPNLSSSSTHYQPYPSHGESDHILHGLQVKHHHPEPRIKNEWIPELWRLPLVQVPCPSILGSAHAAGKRHRVAPHRALELWKPSWLNPLQNEETLPMSC